MNSSNRLILGLLVLLTCSALFALSPTSARTHSNLHSASPPPTVQIDPNIMRRSLLGDLTIGGVGDLMIMSIYRTMVKRGGFHSLIDGVAHVWKKRADVTIANLEMVISTIDVWGTPV